MLAAKLWWASSSKGARDLKKQEGRASELVATRRSVLYSASRSTAAI
jgi:hypothetical protein